MRKVIVVGGGAAVTICKIDRCCMNCSMIKSRK